MVKRKRLFLGLIGVNFIYATESIFTKMASQQRFMTWPYLLWIAGSVGVMGIYALLWQQLLSKISVSTAYMFKGFSLIFVLLFSIFLFGETITAANVIGSMMIISGIVLYAKA